MIKINIISNIKSCNSYLKDPNKFFEKKVDNLNKNFKKYKNHLIFFTLLLSGDEDIKKLNKKFRKTNKTTDILSFPFYKKKELKRKLKKDKEIYLGDIILNLNKVKDDKNKRIFRLELDKLWVHGLAHLFGYDHKKDRDFYNMKKIEKKFLSYLN